jgi:hypothetical protein
MGIYLPMRAGILAEQGKSTRRWNLSWIISDFSWTDDLLVQSSKRLNFLEKKLKGLIQA